MEAREVAMRLTVNGEAREIAGATPDAAVTVVTLVEALGLAETRVAVEVNRKIVRRANWPEAMLAEGDVVEIVHFVGGG